MLSERTKRILHEMDDEYWDWKAHQPPQIIKICQCCLDAGELPYVASVSVCSTCGLSVCDDCLEHGTCCQCREAQA